jgi:predicted dehydrogenase
MAKLGIIGTGWGARVQVPAFRDAGFDVAGIAGRDHEKTSRIAAELGVRPFDDWRALIADPSLDLISVVTPPHEHLAMATAALEAGKHLLSEKPMALNVAEAEALVATAKKHPNQLALIDHELRFLPAWREARAKARELGEVQYAEVRYSSPGRGDRTREWNWWSDAERGGGIWGAVGSHLVDTLRFLGNEIVAVQATLGIVIRERPYEGSTREVTSDDFSSITLRFANGALAAMTLSVVAAVDEPTTITVTAEHGALRLAGEELQLATRGGAFTRAAGDTLAKLPGNSHGGAFGTGTTLLARALKAAIDDGDRSLLEPAATFEDGLAHQRVLDAARRSSKNDGRWEAI